MVVYELYWVDPTGNHRIIGVLPERRKNPARITRESVMNWGKMLLGDDVDSEKIFFRPFTIDCSRDRILWHNLSNDSTRIKS